jgi:hypothetical protein
MVYRGRQHTTMALLLLPPALLLAATENVNEKTNQMINLQTGVDLGSSFVGGITFDKDKNRLFVTGGTYARGFFEPEYEEINYRNEANSDCFFAIVRLPNATETTLPQWDMPTRLGYVNDNPEACSTVHYMQNHERVFLLGALASGASLGDTDFEGSDKLPAKKDVALFGQVLSASLDHVFRNRPVIPQHYTFGGHGLFNSAVNYPFAIASAPRPINATDVHVPPIYVASLYSKYTSRWSDDFEDHEIDLTSPFINGNVWGIAVQKLLVNPSNATSPMALSESEELPMQRNWTKSFQTTYFQELQATAMVYVNDFLLLSGSTYDLGKDFAGEQRAETSKDFQDYDGFLVKLNPESGEVASSGRPGEKMKLRIQSTSAKDDIINGICLHPAGRDGLVPYVYVVGRRIRNYDHDGGLPVRVSVTKNNVTTLEFKDQPAHEIGGAFIMQVDLFSMETVWEERVTSDYISAVDCVVTGDGTTIYVSGNVENGAFLPGKSSHGGADVWVTKMNTSDGKAEWTSQIGSDKDEHLAKGGSMVLDNDENPIICGNTKGSVGRVRVVGLDPPDNTTDVFIMTIDPSDGSYLEPNPDNVFQISTHFFIGSTTTKNHLLLSGLALSAVVVFLFLLGAERKWQPVDLWYYSYLADVFRDHKVVMENERLTGDASSRDNSERSKQLDPSETQGSCTEGSASDRRSDLIFV